MSTFSFIKAHKTLLSIAVLLFFIGQPILSSVLISGENTVVVIDLDTESEKENETKNNQEKEFSEENKITTHHTPLTIVFSNSYSNKIAQGPNTIFGSVFLEISNPPPELES